MSRLTEIEERLRAAMPLSPEDWIRADRMQIREHDAEGEEICEITTLSVSGRGFNCLVPVIRVWIKTPEPTAEGGT